MHGPSSMLILGRPLSSTQRPSCLPKCQCESRNWEIDNMDVIFEGFNSKGTSEYLQISISTLEACENENHGASTPEVARRCTHVKSLLHKAV